MIKRTDKYILFNVDNQATGIFSAKFLRKKESEDTIFASLPEDFKVTCRVKEYQEGKGWQTTKEYEVTAKNLLPLVKAYNKVCKTLPY